MLIFFSREGGSPAPTVLFREVIMNFIARSFIAAAFLMWLMPQGVFATGLDVFETGKTFPTDFLFKKGIPNLKGLHPDEMESVLQKFEKARQRSESIAENNLIHLGMAYIHLSRQEYDKAYDILNNKISGEFILDDFKIHFLTLTLRKLAEANASARQWDAAIRLLESAFKQQMNLFISFPSSPFHEGIPRKLALIEKRMGDVYFENEDYASAWTSYNNALLREYPDHEQNHLSIYLALARTYEAGGNLEEAADIYIYLLDHFKSDATRGEALAFLKKNLEALESMNGNTHELKRLLNGHEPGRPAVNKFVARKFPKWPQTGNEVTEKLFLALSRDDFPKILEYTEVVLQEYPGDMSTRGIMKHVNAAIMVYLGKNPWNDRIDHLTTLYPVNPLNRLALKLWEGGFPDVAIRMYQRVLDRFPTQALACHKAIYFMGRIEEDNGRYLEAIVHYKKLLEKYNWGYFTPSAQFKIPWLYRLGGDLDEAKIWFNRLLKYANPDKFRNQDNGFPEPDDFRPPALYWLAQVEGKSGDHDKRVELLKQLVNDFPMDFYAMVARVEMFMPPLDFMKSSAPQVSISRKWGLGEINRKRINRAEKLISIGFLEMGMNELYQVTHGEENPEFLYYLAQLFQKAGGFQKAIGLSWGVSRSHNHSISPSLAEILFPKPYLDKAVRESSQYHLSPYLVMALMRQESAFNKRVVSSARAIGLMQLLPTTATRVARSMGSKPPDQNDLKKADVNIHLGVKYLHELLKDFEDNIIFALASYNAGPGKVNDWIRVRPNLKPLEFMESIPFKETRNYVKKVLRNYVIYKTLYGEGKIHDFQGILTVRNN